VGHYLSNPKLDYVIFLISASLAFFIYYVFIRNGESRKSSKPTQRVTFDDIVGLDSAKVALKEVLDYMMNPLKYNDRGARMRRGVLLYGPPGTGKTTLAKACANEAGIPFYACNAA
jgi:cell division protease FtsH